MPNRRHPTLELVKYQDGKHGYRPSGSLFSHPAVEKMRIRARDYVSDFLLGEAGYPVPLSEEQRAAIARICETYHEKLSWYYREPLSSATSEASKIKSTARHLRSLLTSATPHARRLLFRQLGDGLGAEGDHKRALVEALDRLLSGQAAPQADPGAREKVHLTAVVPMAIKFWSVALGREFAGNVSTAKGKDGRMVFVASGPAFVHGLLLAMDSAITISEVRTAIRTVSVAETKTASL